jgi:hypothetical protein
MEELPNDALGVIDTYIGGVYNQKTLREFSLNDNFLATMLRMDLWSNVDLPKIFDVVDPDIIIDPEFLYTLRRYRICFQLKEYSPDMSDDIFDSCFKFIDDSKRYRYKYSQPRGSRNGTWEHFVCDILHICIILDRNRFLEKVKTISPTKNSILYEQVQTVIYMFENIWIKEEDVVPLVEDNDHLLDSVDEEVKTWLTNPDKNLSSQMVNNMWKYHKYIRKTFNDNDTFTQCDKQCRSMIEDWENMNDRSNRRRHNLLSMITCMGRDFDGYQLEFDERRNDYVNSINRQSRALQNFYIQMRILEKVVSYDSDNDYDHYDYHGYSSQSD